MNNWTVVNKPFHELDDISKAGMIFQMEDGTVHLIGTVNEHGGICGCCCIAYEIVRRYRKVECGIEFGE